MEDEKPTGGLIDNMGMSDSVSIQLFGPDGKLKDSRINNEVQNETE